MPGFPGHHSWRRAAARRYRGRNRRRLGRAFLADQDARHRLSLALLQLRRARQPADTRRSDLRKQCLRRSGHVGPLVATWPAQGSTALARRRSRPPGVLPRAAASSGPGGNALRQRVATDATSEGYALVGYRRPGRAEISGAPPSGGIAGASEVSSADATSAKRRRRAASARAGRRAAGTRRSPRLGSARSGAHWRRASSERRRVPQWW